MNFTKGNKISYIGDDFKEWFGTPTVECKEISLQFKKLERDMIDSEILSEFKSEEITLEELGYVFEKDLLDKKDYFICYIRDKEDILRAVDVRWFGGGWRVNALEVSDPCRWGAGYQVFSRKFLDTQTSDSLIPRNFVALEARIKALEDKFNEIFR